MASENIEVIKEEQIKEEMDLNCKAIQNMNREKTNEDKKKTLAFVPGNPSGKTLDSKKTLTRPKNHDGGNNQEPVKQFSQLKNHIEKSFKCKICDATFTRNLKLTDHIAGVHEKSKKCDICSSHFTRQDLLTRHIKQVHEGKK